MHMQRFISSKDKEGGGGVGEMKRGREGEGEGEGEGEEEEDKGEEWAEVWRLSLLFRDAHMTVYLQATNW